MITKGADIFLCRVSNGYQISAEQQKYFYPTKKALLSAIDRHFSESRKKEFNLVDEANRILAGPKEIAE